MNAKLKITKLSSGYWCITDGVRGNFVQLPVWPCDEAAIRQHAFAGASESFLLAVVKDAQSTTSIEAQ